MTGSCPDSDQLEGWASRKQVDRLSKHCLYYQWAWPCRLCRIQLMCSKHGLHRTEHRTEQTHLPTATGSTRKPQGLPMSGAAGKHPGWRKGCWGERVPKGGPGPCVFPRPPAQRKFHVDREKATGCCASTVPATAEETSGAGELQFLPSLELAIQTALLIA